MAALDSLIPTLDDESTGFGLGFLNRSSNVDPTVSRLVDYSDDDMPAAMPAMPPLESDDDEHDYGADIDSPPLSEEAEEAEETEEADDLNTSADVDGRVEDHPLEKNPLEMFTGINICIYSLIFCLGMISAMVIAKMNSV
jgi:hypothetical protein